MTIFFSAAMGGFLVSLVGQCFHDEIRGIGVAAGGLKLHNSEVKACSEYDTEKFGTCKVGETDGWAYSLFDTSARSPDCTDCLAFPILPAKVKSKSGETLNYCISIGLSDNFLHGSDNLKNKLKELDIPHENYEFQGGHILPGDWPQFYTRCLNLREGSGEGDGFSCSGAKTLKTCRKHAEKCVFFNKQCVERTNFPTRAPTSYPTRRPTTSPTLFSCSNAGNLRSCRSLKFRKKCVYFNRKCVERTKFPTRAPTVYPTRRPTTSPTLFSCSYAANLRSCRSLKFRKKCVYFNKECVERTAFPTRSPTPFTCTQLNRIRCRWKRYKGMCVLKNGKCQARE